MSKKMNKNFKCTEQLATVQEKGRKKDFFMLEKKLYRKSSRRVCRQKLSALKKWDKYVELQREAGLKNSMIAIMWRFVDKKIVKRTSAHGSCSVIAISVEIRGK